VSAHSRFNARELDDLGPFRHFGGDERLIFSCAHQHGRDAELRQPSFEHRLGQRGNYFPVEQFENIGRYSLGAPRACQVRASKLVMNSPTAGTSPNHLPQLTQKTGKVGETLINDSDGLHIVSLVAFIAPKPLERMIRRGLRGRILVQAGPFYSRVGDDGNFAKFAAILRALLLLIAWLILAARLM
jgi:hypothetical protein